MTTDAGSRSTPFGEHPTGFLTYTADGRMHVIGAANGRTASHATAPPDEEQLALHQTMFAYAGRYSIDAGEVIHHVDISWNELWTGTDQRRFVELRENTLTLSTHLVDAAGATALYVLTWEKLAESG